MEHTHTIKLSSGKEIELTDEEYMELKQEFKGPEAVPYYPYYPVYPSPNMPWFDTWVFPPTWITQQWTPTTCATVMVNYE